MTEEPFMTCEVREELHFPVRARVNDLLVIWPGHPTHTLAVLDPQRTAVTSHCFMADKYLFGYALGLMNDERIVTQAFGGHLPIPLPPLSPPRLSLRSRTLLYVSRRRPESEPVG